MLKAKYWIPLILGSSLILGVVCNLAAGSPHYIPPVKYGQQFTLYFNVFDSNSPWRFYATAPAAADVHIIKDGGTAAAPTNAITDLGKTFSLVLTATEMQAATIIVEVNDLTGDTAAKLFMDDSWAIPTYGHTLALNRLDLDMANVSADANVVSDKTGYALTQTFPTNFSSLSIDTNGTANAELVGIHGTDAGAHNALIVFSTDFGTDYNETLNMWNSNVKYVRDEMPEADVIDTLNTRIDGVDANVTSAKNAIDTIEGYTDDIGVAGAGLTAISATVDFNDLFAMTPSKTATEGTLSWIFAWIQDWVKRVR